MQLENNQTNNPSTSPESTVSVNEQQNGTNPIWEVVKFFLLALLIVAPIRIFIAQPFIVSGASMDPTFATGEYLIVDEISYRFNEPERGDVIVLKYPRNPSKFFIKRIVGLPGETLTMTDGSISITSTEVPIPWTLNESYVEFTKSDNSTITLAEDEYFVMGDNRSASLDSRSWGPLPENMIVGRALLRLFPITQASFMPGEAIYSEADIVIVDE